MNKQIAVAYGIAGIAVALSVITIVGTGTNLFAPTPDAGQPPPEQVRAEPDTTAPVEPATPAESPSPAIEYVYVDEPASPRSRSAREHDDDDDEHGERRERHDDDDDDDDDRSEHENDDEERDD